MSFTTVCPACRRRFTQTCFPSLRKTYCSILCRNRTNARRTIATKVKTCPICGHQGYRKTTFCRKHGSLQTGYSCTVEAQGTARRKWTPDLDAFLREHYPNNGSHKVAELLNISRSAVVNRAGRLGLKLNESAYKVIVNGAAKKYMSENNPMLNLKVRTKVKLWWANHPEIAEATMAKLTEAQQKYQKDKPSSAERLLFAALLGLGVSFEPFAVIKPGLIVDARIGSIIVQVDGDYWHGHPRYEPLSERQIKQQARDASINKYLSIAGFQVIRVWESELTPALLKALIEQTDVTHPQA